MPSYLPTGDELRVLFSYDPMTGEFLWKDGHRKGLRADYKLKSGYRKIGIKKYPYEAHRLAWVYMTGRWPERIDHVDLDPSNNAFKNLREALPWQNNANVQGRGSCKKGVTRHKGGRYQAQIKLGGRNFYLGLFDTEDEANAAYAGAAKVLFGEFSRAA